MNLSVGIVGLPNAGKSTLFNALLKKQVAYVAAFPFATIEPNVGVVPVPDARLPVIAKLVNTTRIVPATIKFVDIAGLVEGAHKGEGLGNKFLSHIREVDLICHVLRAFTDPDVVHVAGEIDFVRDKEIVEAELIFADLATLAKQSEPRGVVDQDVKARWGVIMKLREELNRGKSVKDVLTDHREQELVKDLHLLTMKPVLYVRNVSEGTLVDYSSSEPKASREDNTKNEGSSRLRSNDTKAIVISAKIEAELAGLPEKEQCEYLTTLGLEKSGLERLIQKAYEKLDLISFLTGGEKEARAWTITRGTKAPQAAGVVHTDFEKGFIKADVVDFTTFAEVRGWARARELGKVRLEGKEYEMRDGDVVDFKVNV